MKKIIIVAMAALITLPFVISAQENSYSMVITMANGTTITIGPNEVKDIQFNDGQVTVSGEKLDQLVQNLSQSIQHTDSLELQLLHFGNNIAQLEEKSDALKSAVAEKTSQLTMLIEQCKRNCSVCHETLYTFLTNNYYTKGEVFTKAEVNDLLANLNTGEMVIGGSDEKVQQALDQIKELKEKLINDYVTKDEMASQVLELNMESNAVMKVAQNAQSAADNALFTAYDLADSLNHFTTNIDNAIALAQSAKDEAQSVRPRVEATETYLEVLSATVQQLQATCDMLEEKLKALQTK